MKQQQQELAIETEIQGYKKDIVKEQVGPLCLLAYAVMSLTALCLPDWYDHI